MLGVPGRGSLFQGPVLVKAGGQGAQNGNTDWENVLPHPTWGKTWGDLSVTDRPPRPGLVDVWC